MVRLEENQMNEQAKSLKILLDALGFSEKNKNQGKIQDEHVKKLIMSGNIFDSKQEHKKDPWSDLMNEEE